MNSILIFSSGELVGQLNFRTKKTTEKNYKHIKKHGFVNAQTGTVYPDLKIEKL